MAKKKGILPRILKFEGKTLKEIYETASLRALMAEPWTILSLLNWTTQYFNQKGIVSARLEAELLLSFSLNCKRIELYTQFDHSLNPSELAHYKSLIERRAKREPLAYITGQKEFYSLPFKVSPAVLIPRPETELMVEGILDQMKNNQNGTVSLLDLGVGSGCIIATLCKNLPNLEAIGIDISKAALEIANQNITELNLANQVKLFHADFTDPSTYQNLIPPKSIDILTSNPPYIPEDQLSTLEPEIHYEPKEALSPGNKGLESYDSVIECAQYCLKNQAEIWLELGEGQSAEVIQKLENKGFKTIKVIKDYQGIDRILNAKNIIL